MNHPAIDNDLRTKEAKPETDQDLHRLEFRAMGSQMSVWVVTEDEQTARTRLIAACAFIRAVETRLSRFRPESELSRLNTLRGSTFKMSPLFAEILDDALRAAEFTEGLYNPTVLNALESAGYDRTFEAIEDDQNQPASVAPFQSDWRGISLDRPESTVVLPIGVSLDLGGIVKGWTAERAADILAPLGPCLVDAGGDIAVRSSPFDQAGWPIGIADPQDPDSDLALLLVHNRGVATSGSDFRRWRRGDQSQHHLIDPRTGRPADTDLSTVTVVAADAVEADVHAMVAMILGSLEGCRYLERQTDVEGLLVTEGGQRMITSGFSQYVSEHAFAEDNVDAAAR
jgi:FAD:protein FMN transferase